jgi:PhnB protein
MLGGTPVQVYLYVADCDAMTRTAVAAGAKVRDPVEDKECGDRVGAIEDPFGHVWFIATHKEDVAVQESSSARPRPGRIEVDRIEPLSCE